MRARNLACGKRKHLPEGSEVRSLGDEVIDTCLEGEHGFLVGAARAQPRRVQRERCRRHLCRDRGVGVEGVEFRIDFVIRVSSLGLISLPGCGVQG